MDELKLTSDGRVEGSDRHWGGSSGLREQAAQHVIQRSAADGRDVRQRDIAEIS